MSRRVSQSNLSAALQSTSVVKAVVSQINLSVLAFNYNPQSVSASDSFSLSDSVQIGFARVFSDSLTLSDSIGYDYFSPAFPLNVAVADKFVRVGNSPSLRDGFALTLIPTDVGISISDIGTFAADDLAIGFGLIVSDTLSLSDSAVRSLGLLVEAFDSMFYTIGDSIDLTLGFPGANTSNDQMNLTDSVGVTLSGAHESVDSFSLADSISLSLNAAQATLSDQLDLLDSIALTLSHLLSFSDSMTLQDSSATNGVLSNLGVSVGDQMSMSDFGAAFLSTSKIAYLRSYLNDVVN